MRFMLSIFGQIMNIESPFQQIFFYNDYLSFYNVALHCDLFIYCCYSIYGRGSKLELNQMLPEYERITCIKRM